MLTCQTATSATVQACTCRLQDQAFHTGHRGDALTPYPTLKVAPAADPDFRVVRVSNRHAVRVGMTLCCALRMYVPTYLHSNAQSKVVMLRICAWTC